MNESLRRALLRARLSEEDVAARLQVDPKTVRRWLEGRIPYPRHRWLLAAELGLDEGELWPQLPASRSWPQEIQAIYPHLKDIPRETWLRLFGNAQERIDILTPDGLFLTTDSEMLDILRDRTTAGVKERICLRDGGALTRFDSLRAYGDVEIRVHGLPLPISIYRSDDEYLIAPSIYGVYPSRTPVIHLHGKKGGELFKSYLASFENIWADANLR
jgi:transcriptional regulator with XRE-family HTH domain